MREACEDAALNASDPAGIKNEIEGSICDAAREIVCDAIRALPIPASDALARALAQARAEEREACALIADATTGPVGPMPEALNKHAKETLARATVMATKREIAAAIRARGKETKE